MLFAAVKFDDNNDLQATESLPPRVIAPTAGTT